MSGVVIAGNTSGSITINAPAVAGSGTLTLPTGTGTIASTGAIQDYSAPQRASHNAVILTCDLSTSNNFRCIFSAGGTLTFTNIPSNQAGYIYLDNSLGYAIALGSSIKTTSTFLGTINTPGIYLISYYATLGSVFLATSGAMA